MFSLFKTKPRKTVAAADLPPAAVNRMSLDERKAYRQEMLYQSIRETFLMMEVVGSMYKFKVMPVDARHHRFVVMVDVAKSFVTNKENRTKSFAALEKHLRSHTYNRYGILITGIYWRVSETEEQFEFQPRATDSAAADDFGVIQARKKPVDSAMAPAANGVKLAREAYQPVSDDEAQAFMDALRRGVNPPAIHVGDQEYKSDLAPLDDGIMIGGTQYGKL
ncbi:MAG: hypothetical protein WA174_10325 [Rhodoferax sp.]